MPAMLDTIRQRQEAIQVELDTLQEIEESADRSPEEVEQAQTRARDLFREFEVLQEERRPLEEDERQRQAIRDALRQRNNVETTDPPPEGMPYSFSRERRDPWQELDAVRAGVVGGAEVRARGRAMIETYAERQDYYGLSHDAAERMTLMIDKPETPADGVRAASHFLTTSSPEYLEVFEHYMNDPKGWGQRAALGLAAQGGGYLVPTTLDPSIIISNAGSFNPFRRVCTVKTTTTNNWNGVTSAGVDGEWTAENTEAADKTPTIATLQITPGKADTYLVGSDEVLEDSDFASQLPGLLADAKDRLEEAAFAIGDGSNKPYGVIPQGTALSLASGTAATGPTAASVYALLGALPARWATGRANPVWFINIANLNILRNVASFSGSTTSIVVEGNPPTLLGYPVYLSSSILGTHANGEKVIALLDSTQYYIVDRIGMSVIFDPLPIGASFRPMGQGAWYAHWRVGAKMSVATACRVGSCTT